MLQLNVRPTTVFSVLIERIPSPTDLALSKGPRSVGDHFWNHVSEEWLEDRHASANKTCIDLDDAPEESLGGYPWTIWSCEVSHCVDEAYDGDGPIPKGPISWPAQSVAGWDGLTQSQP